MIYLAPESTSESAPEPVRGSRGSTK